MSDTVDREEAAKDVIKTFDNRKCCSKCEYLDYRWPTDEMYCDKADGEEIFLRKYKRRPNWCPLLKENQKIKKGEKHNG